MFTLPKFRSKILSLSKVIKEKPSGGGGGIRSERVNTFQPTGVKDFNGDFTSSKFCPVVITKKVEGLCCCFVLQWIRRGGNFGPVISNLISKKT